MMDIEEVAAQVVDAAIQVHKALGPGLSESAYQQCLAYELRQRGLNVLCEVVLPIVYGEIRIESSYRVDMIMNNMIVIENKAVGKNRPHPSYPNPDISKAWRIQNRFLV